VFADALRGTNSRGSITSKRGAFQTRSGKIPTAVDDRLPTPTVIRTVTFRRVGRKRGKNRSMKDRLGGYGGNG
jgi:hypothetical protein